MKEQIRERRAQKMGITRMKERLSNKYWRPVSIEEIKDIIEELKEEWATYDKYSSRDLERQDWWLKNLVAWVWNYDKYQYIPETWHVVLNIDWSPYPILVSTIDAMIEQYIRRWDNKSGAQIQNDFWLTAKVWNKLKNTFDIYKDSPPFSIVTLMNISEDELEEVADNKAKKLVKSRMSNIYNTTVQRHKDRKFREFAKAKMWYEVFLEWLDEIVAKYKKRELKKIKKLKNNDNYMCFLTDAHIGKKWTDWIIKRFSQITDDLLRRPESNITITFWGDIWELFTPDALEIHPWQRLGMENITTSDLVMLCVDVLENMLSTLNNNWKKVKFNAILWNHDRISEKKQYDPFRTAGRIIYSFLDRIFSKTDVDIEVLWDKYNTFCIWNIKYLVMHWDWLSPAELNRLAIQEVEKNKYLCIISWDKHHLKMSEISDRVMWVQSPALAWPWKYDKSLAMSSLSWYLWFKVNTDWLLDVWIHRLI